MNFSLSLFYIFLLAEISLASATGVAFRQGEAVELTKSDDLYFNSTFYRRANKGERFAVAEHRPFEKRLFVFAKDKNQQVIALNLPDSSVCPLIHEWAAYAEKAFHALQEGQIKDAKPLLAGLKSEAFFQPVCQKILERVQSIETKNLEYQSIQKNKRKTIQHINRLNKDAERLRNTDNTLMAGSNRNLIQASRLESEATNLAQKLESTETAAERAVAEAINGLVKLSEDLDSMEAHAEAWCVFSAAKNFHRQVFPSSPGQGDFHPEPSSYRLEENKNFAEDARQTTGTVRSQLSEKRFFVALASVNSALQKDKGSLVLNRLREEITFRIKHSEEQLKVVEERRQSKDYEKALELLATTRAGLVDSDKVTSLESELKKIVQNRSIALENAKELEKNGEYERALKIFEQYLDSPALVEILEKCAKKREESGNYLGAMTAYERANKKDLALSLKERADAQKAEYREAEKFSSEGKFKEAAAIYKKFGDSNRYASEKNEPSGPTSSVNAREPQKRTSNFRRGPLIKGFQIGMTIKEFEENLEKIYPNFSEITACQVLDYVPKGDLLYDTLTGSDKFLEEFNYHDKLGYSIISTRVKGDPKIVVGIQISEELVLKMFDLKDLTFRDFCQNMINRYRIPELSPERDDFGFLQMVHYSKTEGYFVTFKTPCCINLHAARKIENMGRDRGFGR